MLRFLVLASLLLSGCQSLPVSAAPPVATPTCDACREALDPAAPQPMSVYNLESSWRDQEGRKLHLKDLQGRVQVLAMVYSSCQNACPRIIADMRALQADLDRTHPGRVGFVLVSLDPLVDTPQRLKQLAERSHLGAGWRLLCGSPGDVQELSAVLGFKYRKISATDYAHSNLINVLDASGVVVHRQEGLGVAPTQGAAVIRQLLAGKP